MEIKYDVLTIMYEHRTLKATIVGSHSYIEKNISVCELFSSLSLYIIVLYMKFNTKLSLFTVNLVTIFKFLF